MIFVLLLLILTGFSLVLQDFIPVIDVAYHARVFIVPVVFFACAISVPFPVMLLLAFVTGFAWDALHCVMVTYADDRVRGLAGTFPDVAAAAVQLDAAVPQSGAVFGFTIFLYGLLGAFMHGVRPLFRRGRWELPVLMTGAGVFLLLTFEYLFINFRRGGFSFPVEVWQYILATALLSMIASPLLLLLVSRLATLSGYQIRYEGLGLRRRALT